jgi:hypothetical protein
LVITEADNFKVAYLSKKELATEYEKFKKKFTSEAKFSAFKETYSFSESELKQILTRHLRVESFIKEKILSAYVYLSPEEVRQFMDDHSGWSRKDSEARLRQRRIRQNLKDWIQSLKERHHIKTIWE